MATTISVNSRTYRLPPYPIVVICFDGCGDDYLTAAMSRGVIPNLQRMMVDGHRSLVRSALPSFTNVNNMSIVTGVPPSRHGICGNYFLEPNSNEEVMMNSPQYLRAESILAEAARAGRAVAAVTAKEKLRDLLAHGWQGIAFSSECAGAARPGTHGIGDVEDLVGRSAPSIYSPEASLFVLASGAALLREQLADFLYLSLTDYVQHAYAPDDREALEFYSQVDEEIGRLQETGAVIAVTADHGMNAKCRADGSPNVIYLEDVLASEFGGRPRVILPITDPYVRHHGALGSFATIYTDGASDQPRTKQYLQEIPGVTEVYTRDEAARKLELPRDRIGELVVLSGRDVVLGRTPDHHDLTQLPGGLRSHGGRYEEMVPLLVSRPLTDVYLRRAGGDPRNFDVFDFVLNGVTP